MNPPLVPLCDLLCLSDLPGLQNGIPISPEALADQLADSLVILYNEDRFRSSGRCCGLAGDGRLHGLVHLWQVDLERCPAAGLARAPDVASALLYDAVDGREA